MSTKAGREHMARIKRMRCICCYLLDRQQQSITDCHHIREGQGAAQRAGDHLTIPLCHDDCHQGPLGIHGDKTYLRLLKMTELDLLDLTYEQLARAK